MIWAVFRIRRISLKDYCYQFNIGIMGSPDAFHTGATNLRELIARLLSCASKASTRASGVKKVPTDGTRNFNLDLSV